MNPFVFLVDTLFHLYAMALLLRFLLQTVRANFYNPISQALVTITNPVLVPLRRVIPGFRGVDIACIVAMLVIKMLGLWLVLLIEGRTAGPGTLIWVSVYQLLDLTLLTFIVTILIQAVISWVNPGVHSPATALLSQLTAPLLNPARRVIPPMGGLDLSPLFVLITLQFLRIALRSIL